MNKNMRNFFKSAKCTLGVWALMVIGLLMSGDVVDAQNTKNTNTSKKTQKAPEMSPTMAKLYDEYLKRCGMQDTVPCLSAAEFMDVYKFVARRSALNREISERIMKIDRELRGVKTDVYGWPGAAREARGTWR